MHDESLIAARDKFLNVSDEKVSTGRAQHDDQSAQQDRDSSVFAKRDTSCAFGAREQGLHQRSVPLTKDSIDKEALMKMPNGATPINAPREIARGERCLRFSVRDQTSGTFSDVQARDNTDLKACEEQSVVIMKTPGRNVNAGAELVFDMMLNSEFEAAGKGSAFYTIPS